jgi:hypothetical protein
MNENTVQRYYHFLLPPIDYVPLAHNKSIKRNFFLFMATTT